MTKHLTPAQQEAITACITEDQRVEFSESSPSFLVYSASTVKPRQFEGLADAYEVDYVRQSYDPDSLKPAVCVCFWLE